LSDESQAWVEQGLISEAQRGDILGSYVVTKRLPVVVLALGVLMTGIGILSFIAANWQTLPPWIKVSLIVGGYLGSVVLAYCFERKGRWTMAELLLFLSGLLLLGGLALISQVFHIQGEATDLLGTWLLVYAPTFLLVRNLSIYLLYESVGAVYINMLYLDVVNRRYMKDLAGLFDVRTLFSPYQPLLVMLLLIGVAWWSWNDGRRTDRSDGESKLKRFFVGGSSRRIFFSNFFILNWFTWICAINSTGRTFMPFVLGVLLTGAAICVMAWRLDSADLDWQGLLCVGLSGIALSFPWIWNMRRYGREFFFEPLAASILLGVWLVYRIVRRQRNGGFAVFLFCALLARWYFDMFYSFMSKSFFFTAGGLLLLLLAFAYRQWLKATEKTEKADENQPAATRAAKISGGDDDE
jgi:uncharacterized membrane protein